MSRYRFELATENDDADLRHVLAATPMDGRISVAFHREPSWFAGAVVDGHTRQVVVCRDLQTRRIVGFGCRSIRDVYVNGEPAAVGYLSSLRALPEYRNRGLLARGYAFFRELHSDGRVPFYLTTIAAGNRAALAALASGRAGLPKYHGAGAFHTVAVTIPRRPGPTAASTVIVRPATAEDFSAVLDFLREVGPRRQFFPRLEPGDFHSPAGAMRDLPCDNLLLAQRRGRLVGMLAGWDQHSFRQSVVHAYHGPLRWLRPLYNTWARCVGEPALPRPGDTFRYLMGALPVVAEDDEHVFASLLAALRRHSAGGRSSHILVGLHDSDPLLRVVKRHQAACYLSYLYLVCWQDGESARVAVDARTPYLEAGSL
jgi:hypothetical protein